jgi:hypothetical protein
MTKASDNAFPSILITEGTEPSAPAAGKQRLYIDSSTHKLKRTDSSGTDVTIESAGGDVATDAIWDAAGDLAVGTGANTAAKLTKGSDSDVLTISASTHLPVWQAPAGGVSADLLPWHIIIPPTVTTPDASTGTWANSLPAEAGQPFVAMLANAGSNAQNDAITWNIVLAAGTWDVHFHVRESTNTAIITLNFDGASQGTADTYNGSAVVAKVSITDIVVAATAKIAVQLKAATRNGSNSTGWVIGLYALEFRRTA